MTYSFGEFELDSSLFQLRRGGVPIKLEPKVYDVLVYLIRHRDRVVSKDELLEKLWPGEFVTDSVLPRCITTARKAVGDTRARPTMIATVHGRGYRFIAEVREQSGGPAAAPGPAAAAPARGLSHVPAFVGREETLIRLRAALDEAAAGRGRMLLLVGEPGIGKTRTAEELALEGRRRGARIVNARCYEGEGAPAYWPWVQVLRACLRGRDAATLQQELGARFADIARLVPGLAAAAALPSPALVDEARFQLFDSITTFLCECSVSEPLVVVFDDLHWADKPSLVLLQHLAREMGDSRLLVLGTYRDVELRRHHPLVSALGELARQPVCERVHLRGLEQRDVARLIAARTDRPPQEALVTAVHEMTEGNPFFIGEIVGLLEAEGRLQARPDAAGWGILLPQSVREAIGRRLDGLSNECNRLLAVASVVGRDFDVGLLQHILPRLASDELPALPSDVLLAQLDEAVAARILTAESPALGRYAFTHALIRQTLYEELAIPRRLRVHQAAAEVLEESSADDPERQLSQIAHHLFQAAAGGHAEKAIDYAQRAARRAFAMLAYEEAVVHYERALQLLEFRPASREASELRFEIILSLADALSVSGGRDKSLAHCRRAAAIARTLGRPDLLARAALVFGQRAEAGPLPAQELRLLLEEALDGLGDAYPALRSRVLSRLSSTPPYQDSIETRAAMSRQAVELARQAGDESALFDALAAQLWALLGPDHDDERLRAADDLARLAGGAARTERQLVVLEHRSRTFLAYGDLLAADRETAVYEALATELRQPSFMLFAKWYWVARALCDGRFAEGERLMRESLVLGNRIQHPAATGMMLWHLFWLLRQRVELDQYPTLAAETFRTHGDILGLDTGLIDLLQHGSGIDALVQQFTFEGSFVPSVVAYVYLGTGDDARARAAFETLAAHDFADIPRDEWWTPILTSAAEMAATFGDTRRCAALTRLLQPFNGRNAAHVVLRTYGGSMAYFLGILAAAQGRTEEATRCFEAALEQNSALGAQPALVRTEREYGHLLVSGRRRGDVRRGEQLLQQAATRASGLGMNILAERIRKEIIKSP